MNNRIAIIDCKLNMNNKNINSNEKDKEFANISIK